MKASDNELKDAAKQLKENTPAAMTTMLEKQPRAEALKKRADRSKMVTKDVPQTTPGNFIYLFYVFERVKPQRGRSLNIIIMTL